MGLLVCGLLTAGARAESFKLTTGETINGELLSASSNDQGVQIKIGEGQYQRVPWANFSQEDLKNFAKNPKMEAFVEPFIEITKEEKLKNTEVSIKEPPRLIRPARQSLFGAMVSSSVGMFLLLVLYGATIYAGYEVAIFRAQPPLLICGLSAVPLLGFLAPIAFLALPTKVKPGEALAEMPPEPAAETAAAATEAAVNPMQADGAAHPAGLKLAATEAEQPKAAQPQATVYKRGQFTFNRRFVETKFPGFFGVVKRDAERDLVLIVKSARGEYVGQRISRIAANDLHLQVQRGHASEEVMIPFQEIQEIRVEQKPA